MIRVGIVGYGYWGPNLVRNFVELPDAEVAWVCDRDTRRLDGLATRYPHIERISDYTIALARQDTDAIVVATPISTHFPLALQALEAGRHVLVEKPLADSSERCQTLIAAAKAAGKTLMVDHTFPYTPAVRKIRDMVKSGALGQIYYVDSTRINLGLFQHDVNVVWDLAIHDLSILDAVLPNRPTAVSATGWSHVRGHPENTAWMTLFYPENCIAHVHVNWLAPVKLRRTLIGGSEKMIVYDDTEVTEKVKVYDKGITVNPSQENIYEMRVGYRAGDMWAPRLDGGEALRTLAAHFVECIRTGATPESDGECGHRLVRMLEAACTSMSRNGEQVLLDDGASS